MDFSDLKNKILSALGQASDSAKDIGGKAFDATKDFAGKAADKAKAGGRIAKLSMEVAQEKENMKKTYLEIGKLYYDTHKDDSEGFFIQLCEEISIAEKTIADKEAEIASLKEGFGSSDPDIDVEFEEVVAEEESAAEAPAEECAAAVEEAAETVAEEAEAVVEDAVEAVQDAVEEAADTVEAVAEKAEEAVEDAFNDAE